MSLLAALLMPLAVGPAVPVVVSQQAAPAAPQVAQPIAPPAWWNPAADYVTAGQDEPGYRGWLARQPWRAGQVAAFHRYLEGAGVAFVVPTWQLLRTASDWQRCGAEPFDVPPPSDWANVVQTLRYVRDYVVPAVGGVEPVSAYRNALLNRCAGGAPNSVHQHLSAVDLVPLYPTSRDELMRRLCPIHALEGQRYAVGLGFYAKLRFHVDSWKFRTWGRNDAGGLACPRSYQIASIARSRAAQDNAQPASTPSPPATSADPLAPRK